jgi:hypothetical protein
MEEQSQMTAGALASAQPGSSRQRIANLWPAIKPLT